MDCRLWVFFKIIYELYLKHNINNFFIRSYLLNIQFFSLKSNVNNTNAIMNDWVDIGANLVFSPSNLPANYTYTPTICSKF